MKVRATLTATVDYEIDPINYSYYGKDIVLAIEKEYFELNPAFFVTLPHAKITVKVEEVE